MQEDADEPTVRGLIDLKARADALTQFDSIGEFLDAIERDPYAACTSISLPVITGENVIEIEDQRVLVPQGQSVEARLHTYMPSFYRALGIALADDLEGFLRWTNDPAEVSRVRTGTQRPSQNHATGEVLVGLSVSRGPWHYFQKTSFAYLIAGTVVAIGPDGEPILDIRSLTPLTESMPRRDFLEWFCLHNRSGINGLAERLSLSNVEALALLLGVF